MKEYQTTSAREDIERTVKHKDHNYLRSKPRGLRSQSLRSSFVDCECAPESRLPSEKSKST
jgi:hypothetical protein